MNTLFIKLKNLRQINSVRNDNLLSETSILFVYIIFTSCKLIYGQPLNDLVITTYKVVINTTLNCTTCAHRISERSITGWYVSAPHWSHVYVATCIIGLTSVVLVTIPFTHTNFPICSAFTFRIATCFWLPDALKKISLKNKYEGIKFWK